MPRKHYPKTELSFSDILSIEKEKKGKEKGMPSKTWDPRPSYSSSPASLVKALSVLLHTQCTGLQPVCLPQFKFSVTPTKQNRAGRWLST